MNCALSFRFTWCVYIHTCVHIYTHVCLHTFTHSCHAKQPLPETGFGEETCLIDELCEELMEHVATEAQVEEEVCPCAGICI
jgi:hypothetical protein